MGMNVIVLAGGFARRMWPLTKEHPKHLLDVGGRPMLGYVLDKIMELDEITTIYISTNLKFREKFQDFIASLKPELRSRVELFIEDSRAEEEKLGSIGAMNYLIREKGLTGELIIIGGDNLFQFSLKDMVLFAREQKGDAIAVYDVGDLESARKYGIVTLDPDQRIVDFLEKPKSPPTTLAGTACYFFTAPTTALVAQYITEGQNADAMGHFISWLHKRRKVYGFCFDGFWFDIGSFESLEEANQHFRESP